jgi:hypothetical protein
MNLTSIDWMNHRYTRLDTGRSDTHSEDMIVPNSASTYVTLNFLEGIYQIPQAWSHVVENSSYVTAINMIMSTSEVQSISVQALLIIDMYNTAKDSGPL